MNETNDTGNIIVALDLGSSHLTMMAGRVLADKTVEILGVERERCRGLATKGILDNPNEVATRIVRMCKQLKNRIGTLQPLNKIFVTLGGKGLHVTEAEVERSLEPVNHVSDKILREMEQECRNKFERSYQQFSVAEVIWENFILDNKIETNDPSDQRAKRIKGTYEVYYGPAGMRYNWDECIGKQDQLQVQSYFVNTEALRTALINSDEEQEGCAIINFGSDTTTFCAYYHGKLLDLCVVPLGSHNITKDIAYKAISITDADKLKERHTSLITPQNVSSVRVNSAVQPDEDVFFRTDTLSNIAAEREKEILEPILQHIDENIEILENKTLYITGGGALQKGLIPFLQNIIPMDVRMGTFIERLSEYSNNKYASPEYAQIVGTIMLAAEYYDNIPQTKPTTNKKEKKTKKEKSFGGRLINLLFQDNNDNDLAE